MTNKMFGLCIVACLLPAHAAGQEASGACSATAAAVLRSCTSEVKDDYRRSTGVCITISEADARAECVADANAARREGNQLCRSQRAAREKVCTLLGQDRYDPDFDPAAFDRNFTRLTNPNPYFPLGIGNRWHYRGGTESVTVEVLNKTKLIEGVRCIVVRDRVSDDGDLVEDTDDWFAQAKDGSVWYCGEEAKDYESFEGDRPAAPELVSIHGSFKAGRDGDKPGIIFPASPARGDVYREEFSLGNAEDLAEVLSTTYAFGREPQLDRFVPRRLAELLCAGDCVVTRNFTPIEPGINARKYYAPGIGFFLETTEEGTAVQLVRCNFDPRCARLPSPR